MAAQPPTEPNIDVTSPYTPRRPSPIVSISLNHPIGTLLRKIKNFLTHKQTLFSTSFTIKITPIVAIVSLFGIASLFGGGITTAYNFGKTVEQKFLAATITPTPTKLLPTPAATVLIVSKSGTIKATYLLPTPVSPTNVVTQSLQPTEIATDSSIPRNDMITPIPTPQTLLHYILVSKSGSIMYLNSSVINLQNYLNLRVLVTGSFNTNNNTLTINKTDDIEVLQ